MLFSFKTPIYLGNFSYFNAEITSSKSWADPDDPTNPVRIEDTHAEPDG